VGLQDPRDTCLAGWAKNWGRVSSRKKPPPARARR
jgi:hypothetical protein